MREEAEAASALANAFEAEARQLQRALGEVREAAAAKVRESEAEAAATKVRRPAAFRREIGLGLGLG